MNNLGFLSELSYEDEICQNFIKYLHNDIATKYLVARLKDNYVSKTHFNNLDEDEIEL